jgi:rod shape-determining protein MreD
VIVNDLSKNRSTLIVLAVILAILQLAVVPNVAFMSGRANLCLVLVAVACLGGSTGSASAIGFACGLFYDLAGSGPIGLMALILTLAGFALAASGRSRVADDFGASLAIFIPLSLIVAGFYAIVLLVCGQSSSIVDAIFFRALPGAVLDCIAFVIVAFVLSRSSSGAVVGGRGGSRFSTKGL